MKNLFLLLIFTFCASMGMSQIVISEIMFNPPESGNDSLEYIEFANIGSSDYSLDGHLIKDAVVDTFTAADVIPAGGFYVTAIKSSAMQAIFGVNVHQWKSGALNNSGETITLIKEDGTVVATAAYSSSAGWPTEPAGNGASLELCDLTADPSDPKNWNASQKNTGIELNGKTIFATPVAANQTDCRTNIVHGTVIVTDNVFTPSTITINEGETVLWKFQEGHHNVNGNKSVFPNNPESFRSGDAKVAPYEYSYTFNVPGTYNYQCDPHAGIMKGVVIVKPKNPTVSYPVRTIGQISSVNGDGVADSLGKKCEISGIVYGVNMRTNGLSTTIIDDARDGIGLFHSSKNFGYTVKEGDKVTVRGTVDQFNGLTQIVLDSIWVNSSNNNLHAPREVFELQEADESDLVVMQLSLKDDSDWKKGETFNATFIGPNGEVTVRIVNTTTATDFDRPSGTLLVSGLVGQFDNTSPFTEGYQLLPRYIEDFSPGGSVVNPIVNATIQIFPNPTAHTLNIVSASTINRVELLSLGNQVLQSYGKETNQINLEHYQGGVYLVKVYTVDGIGVKKIIKL